MLFKERGPNLLKPSWALFARKSGRPKSAFTTVWPKRGGPGPPVPLIDYDPDTAVISMLLTRHLHYRKRIQKFVEFYEKMKRAEDKSSVIQIKNEN